MPLTNEDIIASLVAYYQRTGVDMTSLLGDPVFQSMKMREKVEAIKTFAGVLHDGSRDGLSPVAKKELLLDAAWKTGFAVVPAIAAIGWKSTNPFLLKGVHNKTLLGVSLGGVVMGLGAAGIHSYLTSRDAIDNKARLRANLENVVNNPSTTNAVGVLSADAIARQNRSLSSMLLHRISEKIDKADIGKRTTDMYHEMLPHYQREEAAVRGTWYHNPNSN